MIGSYVRNELSNAATRGLQKIWETDDLGWFRIAWWVSLIPKVHRAQAL
jgi:hypothetical protein